MKNAALFSVLCLFICAGCVKQEIEYTKKWGFGVKDKGHYPKLKGYALSLELSPGSRSFKAGYPAELIFILTNRGKKPLTIHEWHKIEANNLRVQCQIWAPGTKEPSPDMWLDLSVPVKKPIWRYPLTIQPGENVFISTPIDFISNMVISPGSERRFFVKADLNLKSVDAAAPVSSISVLPGRKPENAKKTEKK